jgi:hypothetical protein
MTHLYIVDDRIISEYEADGGMKNWQKKLKNFEKSRPSSTLSTTNPA